MTPIRYNLSITDREMNEEDYESYYDQQDGGEEESLPFVIRIFNNNYNSNCHSSSSPECYNWKNDKAATLKFKGDTLCISLGDFADSIVG